MDENKPSGIENEIAEHERQRTESSSRSRRQFLKKGALVSAPVIMSVASRPVLGSNRCTRVVSGQISGNISNPGGCAPGACSPGYWKQDQHLGSWWPQAPYRYTDLFSSAFGVDAFPGATLLQVVRMEAKPSPCILDQNLDKALVVLGFHAVAALQNALTLVGYNFFTVNDVITKFRNAYLYGYVAVPSNKTLITSTKSDFDIYNSVSCPLGNDPGTGGMSPMPSTKCP